MSSTGNVFPGTGESVDRAGLTAWTGPGNITADDATDATCSGTGSDYLVARNFGFTLDAGATISGITVRVEASEHSGGTEPLLAQLQDASAALTGSSKSTSNGGNISGTTKAVYTYGGTADAWGATLTPTMLNDPNFGVRLWFATAHDVRIDYVTLAVEYTVTSFKDAAVTWSGAGTSATVFQRVRTRVAAFTGAGTLTTAFQRVRVRLASWIGAGTFTVTPEPLGPVYKDAAVAFTGAGTASTGWRRLRNRVAAWVGGSALTATVQRVRTQTLALAGAGAFAVAAEDPNPPAGNGNGYSPGIRNIRVRRMPTAHTRRMTANETTAHRW